MSSDEEGVDFHDYDDEGFDDPMDAGTGMSVCHILLSTRPESRLESATANHHSLSCEHTRWCWIIADTSR
jgi:hypothetical protein